MGGLLQTMVFPHDHPDPNFAGKAKGMAAVVKERKSVYRSTEDASVALLCTWSKLF